MNTTNRFVCLILAVILGSPASAQDACATNQWVRLSEAGRLTGEVVVPSGSNQFKAVSRADLALVDSNGKVTKARTNSKGRFTIREVEPGVYSLAAARDGYLAVMSLHVLADDQRLAEDYPTRLTVSVTELDTATVDSAMSRYLAGPQHVRPHGDAFDDIDYQAVVKLVCSDDAYRVVQSEGGMAGRVFMWGVAKNKLRSAPETNVMVFRNGDEIARTVTDDSGVFEIDELGPGTYGLMAAGADGFAVMGFELVSQNPASESDRVSQKPIDDMTLVNQLSGPAPSFGLQLSNGPGARQAAEAAINEDPTSTPEDEAGVVPNTPMAGMSTPPGSYVGGGFAGGGGSGGSVGGGGFGGVAGLAGVGAVIAATAGDDDSGTAVPPAASTATP